MRVAAVTCKAQRTPEEVAPVRLRSDLLLPTLNLKEIPSLPTYTNNEEFEQSLEKLMYRYGKTRMDVINLLNRKAVRAAESVESPVQPPSIRQTTISLSPHYFCLSCVQLHTANNPCVSANQQQSAHPSFDYYNDRTAVKHARVDSGVMSEKQTVHMGGQVSIDLLHNNRV